MKLIVAVVLALVAVAAAAPAENHVPQIIRSDFEHTDNGGYVFNIETEDGVKRDEQGEIKEALDEENKPHSVITVRGSYSYPDEEGKPISFTYFADETGYHVEGDKVPKAPVV